MATRKSADNAEKIRRQTEEAMFVMDAAKLMVRPVLPQILWDKNSFTSERREKALEDLKIETEGRMNVYVYWGSVTVLKVESQPAYAVMARVGAFLKAKELYASCNFDKGDEALKLAQNIDKMAEIARLAKDYGFWAGAVAERSKGFLDDAWIGIDKDSGDRF